MIKKILAVSFSLLVMQTTASYAQGMGDYELFMKDAKGLSNLYRGAATLNYKFKYTGTYFAYSDEFVHGDVLYNDKLYKDVLLNLNSHLDELYVFVKENGIPVMLNKDFVERFRIGDRKYRNFKFSSTNLALEDGYYEVLWSNSSDEFIKKTTKQYEERINLSGSYDQSNKIERLFVPSDKYFLLKDKLAKQIKRTSQIRSIYGVSGGLIRKHIRDNNLDTKHNKDIAFTSIVKFINSSLLPNSK